MLGNGAKLLSYPSSYLTQTEHGCGSEDHGISSQKLQLCLGIDNTHRVFGSLGLSISHELVERSVFTQKREVRAAGIHLPANLTWTDSRLGSDFSQKCHLPQYHSHVPDVSSMQCGPKGSILQNWCFPSFAGPFLLRRAGPFPCTAAECGFLQAPPTLCLHTTVSSSPWTFIYPAWGYFINIQVSDVGQTSTAEQQGAPECSSHGVLSWRWALKKTSGDGKGNTAVLFVLGVGFL